MVVNPRALHTRHVDLAAGLVCAATMSHQFEEILQRRCLENPDVAVLRAQWDFDKRLLSAALQSVGRAFPHYSRHDASHSHTILIQIERFLGADRISKLSATDVWLLLEAAYFHDAGMIVTNADLEELWADAAFQSFLGELHRHSDADFVAAAQWLSSPPLSAAEGASGRPRVDPRWPLHIVRAVTLIVAEYRRRDHARRSGHVVERPGTIGLATPRSGLIPERLFGMLSGICAGHGQALAEVLKLPRCESGVAGDVAHPRFIACMLRLGDLLDLDNGRFCPVMLASFGPVPRSSQAHVLKHAAIKHLRIDPEVIEVEAECSATDVEAGGYEACAAWFDMLRGELRDQQAQWTQIAPMSDFGALPSPGTIQVRLKDLLSLGRLEVSAERFAKFARGANLYETTDVFVRELLQNAVDATLLRLWTERGRELGADAEGDETALARKLLSKYPVEVSVTHVGPGSAPGMQRWRLTVRDRGIGITRADVDYIRRIGSSSSNPSRSRIIASMPEWLRPSGIFGIGLQSLFLKTERVDIESRSILTGEHLKIALLGGRGQLQPAVLVHNVASTEQFIPFGTAVTCEMELDARPTRVSWLRDESDVARLLSDFDQLVDEFLPVDAFRVKDCHRRSPRVPVSA